jgi:hypothetical protein
MAALTFKGLLPPATGAIRAARYADVVAREEWEGDSEMAAAVFCDSGLCGWF